MPAEIRVKSPSLLASADTAARILDEAAAPSSAISPAGIGGASASDAAGAAVAAAMQARAAALTAARAGVGPGVETVTDNGVERLQGQDEQNAEALRAVGQQTTRWV